MKKVLGWTILVLLALGVLGGTVVGIYYTGCTLIDSILIVLITVDITVGLIGLSILAINLIFSD